MTGRPINKLLLDCLLLKKEQSLSQLSLTDWEELTQLAARFGVMPLLYSRLRHISVPDEIARRLRDAYQYNTFSNMRLYTELGTVFEAFKAAEIPLIVLKGAFLAPVVYGDIVVRTMVDADLLVKKRDLARAKEEMLALEYHSPEKIYLSKQHLPPFHKTHHKKIEIHWTILAENSPFQLHVEGLWQRAQPIQIANVEVLGLSAVDLLLHLVLHTSYQHRFDLGIRPFCDIALTICHYQAQIDWQELVVRAFEWRANKALYLTLLLSQELVDLPIPANVLSSLKPANFDARLLLQAKEQILADRTQEPQIGRQITRIWAAEGLQAKVRLFHESLFLPSEVMARLYSVPPGSLRMYLYYFIRLKHLLVQHSHSIWQLFGRKNEKMLTSAKRQAALLEWLSSP